MLGHKDFKTTMIYTHVLNRGVRLVDKEDNTNQNRLKLPFNLYERATHHNTPHTIELGQTSEQSPDRRNGVGLLAMDASTFFLDATQRQDRPDRSRHQIL